MPGDPSPKIPNQSVDHPVGWAVVGIDLEREHSAEVSLHIHVHPQEWPDGHYLCVGLPVDLCVDLFGLKQDRQYVLKYTHHDDGKTGVTIAEV